MAADRPLLGTQGCAIRNPGFREREIALARIATEQDSLVCHAQAVAVGLDKWAIRRRLDLGRWGQVLPLVYVVKGPRPTVRRFVRAAALWAGDGAAISHASAAWLWAFEGFGPPPRPEVTVGRHRAPRSKKVVVHRTVLDQVDRALIDGVPVTSAARTVIDMAGSLNDEDLLAMVESGFDKGLYRASFLSWRLDQLGGRGRAGSGRLRRLLEARGEGAAALQYRLEVKTWRLLTKHGLRPQRQFPVKVDGKQYYLDFAWPEHKVAVECEGFDPHGRRQAFVRDRDRLGDLVAIDWRIFPATWEVVTQRPQSLLGNVFRALDSGSCAPR